LAAGQWLAAGSEAEPFAENLQNGQGRQRADDDYGECFQPFSLLALLFRSLVVQPLMAADGRFQLF